MTEERVEHTFLWFIENYSYAWHRVGDRLQSPSFTADGLENTTWRIRLYPRGKRLPEFVSLFLLRSALCKGPANVSLDYEVSLLASDGSVLHSAKQNYTFSKCDGYGWPKFAKSENVCPDILTVRCRIWKGKGEVHKFAPTCARTRIAVENISFLHVVEDFSALESYQKKTAESRSDSKRVVVSSHLYFDLDEDALTLELTPSDSNCILCEAKVSLIDASGNRIACGEENIRWYVRRVDIRKLTLNLTREKILSKSGDYLPEDKLTLLCECVFSIAQELDESEEIQSDASTTAWGQASNPVSCNRLAKTPAHRGISEDMKALYLNRRLADVELITETKSFPAHKSVLCARSPVFDAMLTSDMKEKHSNCIKIDDLGDDDVQEMLLFMYSDAFETLQWDRATCLYYAGDKYEIGKMKAVCSAFLVENLTPANASELLVLADTHKDGDLRWSVEGFILAHDEEVFGSKEWEALIETNPALASKTMHLKYKERK